MNILILHRIPYHKIDYHRSIDHRQYRVFYLGTDEALQTIPAELPCERVSRPGKEPPAKEAVAALKAHGLEATRFDRVISLSEYELLDAAAVREALGAPGPRYDEVLMVRHKVRMKDAIVRAGIRAPRHLLASAAIEGGAAAIPWQGRTVLKPVDGASSENVLTFDSAAQTLAALLDGSHGIAKLDPARFEIEEFIEGDIIHFDGLAIAGEPYAMLASRYVGTCLGFATGAPLGSIHFDADPALQRWAADCVRAVGIKDSTFHLEVILTATGPVFLEIGARVGGADVVDCFERATGLHLPSLELAVLIGSPSAALSSPPPRPRRKLGWFVFPGHHLEAEYGEARGVEAFLKHPNVARTNVLAPTAPLPRKITYQAQEVPFAGVVEGDTTEELEALVRDIFARVEIVAAPPSVRA